MITPGDTVRFWDGNHGSCISLWGASNSTIKNSFIHNCGASRGIYLYTENLENVTIANNLVYDTLSEYAIDFADHPPKSVILENNTIVGFTHENYYQGHMPAFQYGVPLRTGGGYSAVNNIIVGVPLGGGPENYDIRNNISYAWGYQEDQEGPNRNNFDYYGDEPYGSEPHPFDGSGNFFIGGDNFNEAYNGGHKHNFNQAFHPMITCDACNGKINPAGAAVGALACACTNNSQCENILGAGYQCNAQTKTCQTGTIVLYGDVSGDGEVTAYDAALAAQASVSIITLTAEQTVKADVDGNGEVAAYDAALIAQYSVGIINKFPVEG